MTKEPAVTIVIPTLNEAMNLARLLPELLALVPTPEVIVSDGGSSDSTPMVASSYAVSWIDEARGRGSQLNAGGARASGDIILFLHADSTLPQESYTQMILLLAREPELAGGAFRFSLQSTPGVWARVYEFNVKLRNTLLSLPYGDQGFFIRCAIWDQGYHFTEQPLMEDVEWWQRLYRKKVIRILPWPVITSARRFEQRGYLCSSLRNLWTLTRYKLGVSPVKLAKEYHK
jgi:rSAM/selenodomain-associated transferase 2